jgi:hypothetical protein
MTDELDWTVAIIGYDQSRWIQYLSDYARQPSEAQRLMDDGRRQTHFAQDIDDKSLRREFYRALLKVEWLPSTIRRAVMRELGQSLQKYKSSIEDARTATLEFLVKKRKAQMRADGKRPRAGIHDSAVAEIAAEQGMTAEALKQRITRLNKKRSHK